MQTARDLLELQQVDLDILRDRKAIEAIPGKSEAWIVLWAEEGAKLVYGLETGGRPLEEIVSAGELEAALHWETARPGDVFYIPAGTVHALGLHKIGQSVVKEANDSIKGQINKVKHLVAVEEI